MTTINFKIQLHNLIELQRTAQTNGRVPDAATRRDRLSRAATMLARAGDAIAIAVFEDVGHRSAEETRFEIFGAVNAFRYAATRVENWMQPAQCTALAPDAEARVEYVPLGVIGVVGPWNYPIMCVFGPLAGILAAENRAIIKPSEFTPRTSVLLARLIAETFHPSEVAIVQGDAAEGALFSAAPFDHLMFTGSTSVGRHVMRAAADNLTPVTLELGGKSPVIVRETYDLAEAAQRVIAVKLRNAGQICLAPDYALVPAGSEREFAEQCLAAARRMYPDGLDSVDYTSIINDAHFARLERLVADANASGAKILEVFRPSKHESARRMMPVLILNPPRDTLAMRDEIFGPILPILGYRSIDDALETIRSGPRPLAVYYFGADDERARQVLDGSTSGGVTINDVMTHMFVEDMPYGGIGASGMGTYRGEAGFARSVMRARSIGRPKRRKRWHFFIRRMATPFGRSFRRRSPGNRELTKTLWVASGIFHEYIGGGKTAVIGTIGHWHAQVKVLLVVAQRSAIRDQLARELGGQRGFFLRYGFGPSDLPKTVLPIRSNGDLPKTIAAGTILVSTIQLVNDMARNRAADPSYDRLRKACDAVIVDEGHYEPANAWSLSIRGLGLPTVLVTATPYRNDLKPFEFDHAYVHVSRYSELLAEGFQRDVEIAQALPQSARSPSVFVDTVRKSFIARYGEPPSENRKLIVRCRSKEQVEQIGELMRKHTAGTGGVLCLYEAFTNDTKRPWERRQPTDPEAPGAPAIWVHQHKLLEGVDGPSFRALAFYGVLGSARALVQQIGRVIRNPQKDRVEKALLIDHSDGFIADMWRRFREYDASIDEKNMKLGLDDFAKSFEANLPPVVYADRQFRRRFGFNMTEADVRRSLRLPLRCHLYEIIHRGAMKALACGHSGPLGGS